jgi:hypothetical protein
MNPIAILLAFAEANNWHPIITAAVIAAPICLVFVIFLRWLANKDLKKYRAYKDKIEQDTNPENAQRLRYTGERTPTKGEKVVVINEDLWIIVRWDKQKEEIMIWTPPRHAKRKHEIFRQWHNAKIEEVQKVRIEDLPRIS